MSLLSKVYPAAEFSTARHHTLHSKHTCQPRGGGIMYRRRQEAAEKDEKTEVSTATGQPPSQKSMLEDTLSLPISFSLFLWLTHKYTASTLCSNYKKTHTQIHVFSKTFRALTTPTFTHFPCRQIFIKEYISI